MFQIEVDRGRIYFDVIRLFIDKTYVKVINVF